MTATPDPRTAPAHAPAGSHPRRADAGTPPCIGVPAPDPPPVLDPPGRAGDRTPGRIDRLPRNLAKYPVPWFVGYVAGVPDFRVIRPAGITEALTRKICWVCGLAFQRQEDRAFVIGPMCAVNRVSAEPPSHEDCAVYSATHCPFLTTPSMRRRERHMPGNAVSPAGEMIRRNPGVALVWVTGYRNWKTFDDGNGGNLFDVGEPKRALWFAHGIPATREQVLASIDSGLPILREMAESEGPAAVAELERLHERALTHVPAGAGPDADDAAPAGLHGADWRKQVKAAQSAHNAAQRRGRTRRAPKATGPGMLRKLPPETGGGAT